jgi:tRNA-specific 2-thiouridylase
MTKNEQKNATVVVAMSGGVDSSVAAALLVERGYNVIGITMKTYTFDEVGGNVGKETSCCGLDAINDARMVAVKLGIPHYVADFTQAFSREVIDNFVGEYLRGRTPNPCVICNRKVKWGELLKKAGSLGATYIATGHYARVEYDEMRGRYIVLKGMSEEKDQSYALWGLSQEALSKTIFPLGRLAKAEVRAFAARFGLKTASKEESYEICFVADDDYKRFLRERVPDFEEKWAGGDMVFDGKVVGRHHGFANYTIGQRRNLGAFGERVYVTNIDVEKNTITIGRNEDLFRRELVAGNINWVAVRELLDGERIQAKVRYKDKATPATVFRNGEDAIRLVFDEPKRAITPGQSVVMYDGERLVGGGVIEKAV